MNLPDGERNVRRKVSIAYNETLYTVFHNNKEGRVFIVSVNISQLTSSAECALSVQLGEVGFMWVVDLNLV